MILPTLQMNQRNNVASSGPLSSNHHKSVEMLKPTGSTPSQFESQKCANMGKPRYNCSQCNFHSAYRFVVERHQRKHTEEYFRCHLCPCKFFDKYQLSYHLKGHRGELQCRYCTKVFSSTTCLYYHERKHKLGQI